MNRASPAVLLEIRESIGCITLMRPDSGNTISLELAQDFTAAVRELATQPSVRAVVMTGAGKNFCFGGDLRGMVAAGGDVHDYIVRLTTELHAGIAQLTRLNAPVIVAVNGTTAGGGLGLVLAADVAIAARSAKFTPAYTGVGLTPDAGCTFLLPRVVGYKRAVAWVLTNQVLDAETAMAWGLVDEVVDDGSLIEAATARARRLAAGPARAFGACKRLMAESLAGFELQMTRESESIAARAASAEGGEGIKAFLEKRAPRYP